MEADLQATLGALHFPYCYGAAGSSALPADLRDAWKGNQCVIGSAGNIYSFDSCSTSTPDDGHVPFLSNNTLFADSGTYVLNCGGTQLSLAQAQAIGFDANSTFAPSPSSAGVLAMAQAFVAQHLMAAGA